MDDAFTELSAKIDSLISQNSELRATNAQLVGKQAEDAKTIEDLQAKVAADGTSSATDDAIKAETAKIDTALADAGTDTLSGGQDTISGQ